MRRSFAVMGFLVLAACGPSGVSILAASAPSVSIQSSDAPKGLTRCSQSSDVDTFLKKTKSTDPSAYDTDNSEWQQAKKDGAVAGEFVFYAASTADCDTLAQGANSSATPTSKVIVNLVVQFKDASSASKAYTSESILGFKTSDFTGIQSGTGITTTQGTKTGLGANSVVDFGSFGGTKIYVAAWTNKNFYLILVAFDEDSATMAKVASSINGRVH